MATKELLVLDRLNSIEIQYHAGRWRLPIGLLGPRDVEAFKTSPAHGNPHLLGVQGEAHLKGHLEAIETERLFEADALSLLEEESAGSFPFFGPRAHNFPSAS